MFFCPKYMDILGSSFQFYCINNDLTIVLYEAYILNLSLLLYLELFYKFSVGGLESEFSIQLWSTTLA